MDFWRKLPKPIIGLSPMDGVTDAPFRSIVKRCGNPDVLFTEFVHVQALWRGRLEVYKNLLFTNREHPIVAQVFGSELEYFYKAAHIVCELGFDGIDINMGCPANLVVKRGGGASLITTPKLAQEIIRKTQQGVKDWASGQTLEELGLNRGKINYIENLNTSHKGKRALIPVSVKTRIGYKENEVNSWIPTLLETHPAAITVHGRTFKQLYTGKADWDAIGSVAALVKKNGTIYLGNGDVASIQEGKAKAKQYGVDGVLVGRAALGNPWLFSSANPSLEERLSTLSEHIRLHIKAKGPQSFHQLKKHFGWYCKGFPGAKELRIALIASRNPNEAEATISSSINSFISS
ncbi:MAG: tRNA dihydrouridine synthase [Patescibacteria group bacterium]|jgi:tRNA-dihydrouridine synthase B